MNRKMMFLACILFGCLSVGMLSAESRFVQKIKNAGSLWLGIQATDGAYVTAAFSEGNELVVRKTNSSGKNLWVQRLRIVVDQFPNDAYANPIAMAETTDRGFVIIGNSECRLACSEGLEFIIKLSEDGKLIWKKGFLEWKSEASIITFRSIQSRPDGGFIVTAENSWSEAAEGWKNKSLIRFTSAGDVLWKKGFSLASEFLSSVSTPDNGLVLFYGREGAIQILKFDDSGKRVWKRKLEIPLFFCYDASAALTDNGFVLAGKDDSRLFLIGLNAEGRLAWKKAYSPAAYVRSVRQSPDKGFVLTGLQFLLKIDSSRKIIFQNLIADVLGDPIAFSSSFDTSDGGLLLFGNLAVDDGINGLVPVNGQFLLKLDSKGVPASCISAEAANLKPVAFPSIKTKSGPALGPSNSVELQQKDFSLKSIAPEIRKSKICKD